MTDIPKPPTGYPTWCDYLIEFDILNGWNWKAEYKDYASAELTNLRRTVVNQATEIERLRDRGGCGEPDHVGAVPSDEGTHYCETCRAIAAEAEIERLMTICMSQDHSISQVLGKALGFPRYADDLKNFPGIAPDDPTVFTGAYDAETLAALAADTIRKQTAEIERLQGLLDGGRLMWNDRCDRMFFDRDEIDPRMPSDPYWVIELDRGNTGWRDLLKGGVKLKLCDGRFLR